MRKFIVLFIAGILMLGFPALGNADTISYSISNGASIDQIVDPLSFDATAKEYYTYNDPFGASGNPAFGTQSNVGFFWLYENSLTGDLSLGMIFDTPEDLSGGMVLMDIDGTPGSAFVEVRDDPKHIDDHFNTEYGTWRWYNCCTDGGMIGGLADSTWDISLRLDFVLGIDQWYFLSGDPINPQQVLLDMSNPLVVSAGTEVPEPTSMLLLGSGLLGIMLRRKV